MEQTIIDFFAKSSELILQNRLPTSQLPSTPLNTSLNQNTTRFQLSFARKVDFARTLPSDWTLHNHKLLVLEFFVCSKSTAEKFLAEQWTFQISPDSHERLDDTIDSPSTLYKKLSVLLRTISLLTVTLPLYQKIFRERGSSCLSQSYMIEYSVSYSKDTLSTWHPSVYQNKDLETYPGCDFVLPGRTFSFKVEYSKSLGFLKRSLEDEFERVEAEENVMLWKKTSCVRRAFSDNIYNKGVRTQDVVLYGESMPVGNPLEDGEGFFSSLMEVMPRRRVQSDASKKELIPRIWDMTKVPDASKLKIKTLESESFGEGDIFLCENDEEKFTEVLSWKDISMRNQSPTRIVFQQKDPDGSSGLPILRKMSEDCDKNRMKISMNTKPIEKIIEHTHDDKVAELLNSIEDLKMLSKRQESVRSEQEKVEICESSEMVNEKGLRFENAFKHKREPSEDVCNPFGDMNELKQLYMQIKRLNSAK